MVESIHLHGRNYLHTYFSVIYALCMHDIKTRFFGNGLGQITMILWPFCHIALLLIIFSVAGRLTPYGDSLLVYSSVGILPFIIVSYMSRWVLFSAIQNKIFINYPIIHLLDIMLARAILETISIIIMTTLLMVSLALLGENCLPSNYAQAFEAFAASIFLALGLGVLNGAIVALIPLWNIVYTLFIIGAYAASGIIFVVSSFPKPIRYILSWNPFLQTVEWMRSAYYSDYGSLVLDKGYVLQFGFICLVVGLLLERFTRVFRTS